MTCHVVGIAEIKPLGAVSEGLHCVEFDRLQWVDGESVMIGVVSIYFLDFVAGFFLVLSPFAFVFLLRPFLDSVEESLSDAAVRPVFCFLGDFRFGGWLGDFFVVEAPFLAPRGSFFAVGCLLSCCPSFERSVLIPLSWLASSCWMRFLTVAGSAAASVSITMAVSAEVWLTAKARSCASTLEMAARSSISFSRRRQLLTKISSKRGCSSVDTFVNGATRLAGVEPAVKSISSSAYCLYCWNLVSFVT